MHAAEELGVNLRLVDADTVGISTDETTTSRDLLAVWAAFAEVLGVAGIDEHDVDALAADTRFVIDASVRRTSEFLTHPTFHEHRSETAMLRYLRRLSDKDIALDRAMIPLGSCTMKLNATTEMEPITQPGWAGIHPFAPLHQAAGYLDLIRSLEAYLVEITGYDAVSLQPNAGSQGEFAGLLAIRGYHRARGDEHRDVCLIPSSAHGTNAASAVMAGMRVVVVACTDAGDVDLDDLRAKIAEHGDRLAALMITYPSTFGVYEETVAEICALVHDAGGQVYVDGANLNALVGLAKPGQFGADVSHLNLHKTFCIPHGGGGPGVGPVAVRAHLAPYLPGHPLRPEAGPLGRGHADGGTGPVSGAPWGSAGILPIPWAYIRLMGGDGLTRATQVAVLSANYVAARLRDRYPVLYTGRGGLVAHECIVDLREITKDTGVTVDDVAKRLIDYGFHAPTMSFPVAGTLHDRADRERGPRRARPVLRRDARDPRRDRRRRRWACGRSRSRRCAVHRTRRRPCSASGRSPTRARRPRSRSSRCAPRSTGRRCVASTARTATGTWSAPARRRRRSPSSRARTSPRPGGESGELRAVRSGSSRRQP